MYDYLHEHNNRYARNEFFWLNIFYFIHINYLCLFFEKAKRTPYPFFVFIIPDTDHFAFTKPG